MTIADKSVIIKYIIWRTKLVTRITVDQIEHRKTKQLAKRLQLNVQKLLKERNWTMQELADKAKLSIGTIQEINQGKMTNPRLQTIVDLSDGFGITNPLKLLER